MIKTSFRGNYTYCGTYAVFDSGVDAGKIDKNRFEILTSVPFGVLHSDECSHRLISPIYEPFHGIKRACDILNKKYTEKSFDDKNVAQSYLLERLDGGPVVIGPIEMSKLNYLPLCQIYDRVPHYISLYKDKNNKIRVNDSEGVIGHILEIEEFMIMWDSDNLVESPHKFNIGYIESEGELPCEKEQVVKAVKNCCKNLENARNINQGPYAFEKLWNSICNTEGNKYKNFLFFDMEIFIQRKILMYSLINWTKKDFPCNFMRIEDIIDKQIYTAAQINYSIRNGVIKRDYKFFHELSLLEDELTEIFCEVCENECWDY